MKTEVSQGLFLAARARTEVMRMVIREFMERKAFQV